MRTMNDAATSVVHTCRLTEVWRTGGLSIKEHFAQAAPDLNDRANFLASVRDYLSERPELVHTWQGYVDDKRGTPSPYLDLRSTEVGWMNTRGRREDVSQYDDALEAVAQFIWREANWVLLRQRV